MKASTESDTKLSGIAEQTYNNVNNVSIIIIALFSSV